MTDFVRTRRLELRRAIESLADDMAGARIDVLHGAQRVYRLWREHLALQCVDFEEATEDGDFLFLLGIESETHDVPSGAERSLWAADVLAEVDARVDPWRRQVAPEIIAACMRVREWVRADVLEEPE